MQSTHSQINNVKKAINFGTELVKSANIAIAYIHENQGEFDEKSANIVAKWKNELDIACKTATFELNNPSKCLYTSAETVINLINLLQETLKSQGFDLADEEILSL